MDKARGGDPRPPADIRAIVRLPPGAIIRRVMMDGDEVVGFEIDPGPYPPADEGPDRPAGPAAGPSDGSGAVAHVITSHRDSGMGECYW